MICSDTWAVEGLYEPCDVIKMETLSALLALCEGNRPVTGGFPSQRASNLKLSFNVSLNKLLSKQLRGIWIKTSFLIKTSWYSFEITVINESTILNQRRLLNTALSWHIDTKRKWMITCLNIIQLYVCWRPGTVTHYGIYRYIDDKIGPYSHIPLNQNSLVVVWNQGAIRGKGTAGSQWNMTKSEIFLGMPLLDARTKFEDISISWWVPPDDTTPSHNRWSKEYSALEFFVLRRFCWYFCDKVFWVWPRAVLCPSAASIDYWPDILYSKFRATKVRWATNHNPHWGKMTTFSR